MKRERMNLTRPCLPILVVLSVPMVFPAEAVALRPVPLLPVADSASPFPPTPSPAHGAGVIRFEVEPDEVEVYLDEQYLGRANELRGRALEGVVAGNRLLELRSGGERTFLHVVVPQNGTRTIRLNLSPPRPGTSRPKSP